MLLLELLCEPFYLETTVEIYYIINSGSAIRLTTFVETSYFLILYIYTEYSKWTNTYAADSIAARTLGSEIGN